MPALGVPTIVTAALQFFPPITTTDGMSYEPGAVYLPASTSALIVAYFCAVLSDGSTGSTWLASRSFISRADSSVGAIAALVNIATANGIGGLVAINITGAGSPNRVRFLINGAGVGQTVYWKVGYSLTTVP